MDNELPEFVLDHLGNEVRIGDTIVYAALLGRSATVSVSEVLGFSWSEGYNPTLKIKVQGTERTGRDKVLVKKKQGWLIAEYRRFVLLKKA